MSEKMKVGFIGLGMMGKPMAKRVLGAGFPLTVHDVRPEPVEELVKEGAKKASSPKEVAQVTDVVLTSLPTLEACEQVYRGANGLLKGGRAGQTFVETSTTPPSVVRSLSEEARKQGIVLFDAAMYSRSMFHPGLFELTADQIAAKGLITLLVGGDPAEIERVRPVLSTFGNPILHLGPVGSGELAKVLANALVHAFFTVTCEVFAVGAKAGMDMRKLHEIMSKTGPKSWVIDNVITQYLEKGTGKMMRTEVAVKDSESMLQLGRELGVPLLMQSLKHSYYEWAKNSGLKDRPWDEMLKLWEEVIGRPIRFS